MTIDRDFLAQVVIVLAICAGAWLVVVQSRAAEVARLQGQLSEIGSTSALASQEGIEALAAKFATYKSRLQAIEQRNRVSVDTSSLYASIMRLATESQVTVHSLQPTQARDSGNRPQAVRASRLEITISGKFEDVSRFLDSVFEIDAHIRPTGLHLIPTDHGDKRIVSARFTCEILAFAVDEALASIGGANNGQS